MMNPNLSMPHDEEDLKDAVMMDEKRKAHKLKKKKEYRPAD